MPLSGFAPMSNSKITGVEKSDKAPQNGNFCRCRLTWYMVHFGPTFCAKQSCMDVVLLSLSPAPKTCLTMLS